MSISVHQHFTSYASPFYQCLPAGSMRPQRSPRPAPPALTSSGDCHYEEEQVEDDDDDLCPDTETTRLKLRVRQEAVVGREELSLVEEVADRNLKIRKYTSNCSP